MTQRQPISVDKWSWLSRTQCEHPNAPGARFDAGEGVCTRHIACDIFTRTHISSLILTSHTHCMTHHVNVITSYVIHSHLFVIRITSFVICIHTFVITHSFVCQCALHIQSINCIHVSFAFICLSFAIRNMYSHDTFTHAFTHIVISHYVVCFRLDKSVTRVTKRVTRMTDLVTRMTKRVTATSRTRLPRD